MNAWLHRGVGPRQAARGAAPAHVAALAVGASLAASIAACSSSPVVAPAHAIRPIMPTIHLAATLTLENGCPLLNDGSGSLLPIWPQGVTVADDTLRMREAPVSRVGELLTLGGHWLSREDVGKTLLAPLPAGCTGTGRIFWVQTFELGS